MSLAFHKNPSFSSFLIGLPPSRYPLTSTDCVRCFPSGFFMCLSELGGFLFSAWLELKEFSFDPGAPNDPGALYSPWMSELRLGSGFIPEDS